MISTSVVAIRSPVWITGRSLETFRVPRLGSGFSQTQIRLPGVKPRQLSRSVRMSGGVESMTTQEWESVQSTAPESKAVNGHVCYNFSLEHSLAVFFFFLQANFVAVPCVLFNV